MKIQTLNEPSQEMLQFREVEMDEGIIYLKYGTGFKTFGVSSCIVFVAYYRNMLLCMLHWSPPDTRASLNEINQTVTRLLKAIENSIAGYNIDLKEVTVYALGGQQSSHGTVVSLAVKRLLKNQSFTLNVDFLFIASYEDCFDLYVCPGAETFWIVRHHTPVTELEITEAKAQMTHSFDILALYCHELYQKRRGKEKHKPVEEVFEENCENRIRPCPSA